MPHFLTCGKVCQKSKDYTILIPTAERWHRKHRLPPRTMQRKQGQGALLRLSLPRANTVSPGPETDSLALYPLGKILALSK